MDIPPQCRSNRKELFQGKNRDSDDDELFQSSKERRPHYLLYFLIDRRPSRDQL
jgi:hypothetical protein